jgi:CRISPR-associated protein Csh1
LQRIGILTEGGAERMREFIAAIPDRLEKERTHLEQSGFNELQAALFLLGCAINKVADAQDIELKSRPILRKINFRGMSFAAIQKLASEVFEKGLQYKNTMKKHKFLGKYEIYYQEMSRLLDLAIQDYMPTGERKTSGRLLSESELVYYIISGYAFANAQKATSRTESELAELDVAEDEFENEEESEE